MKYSTTGLYCLLLATLASPLAAADTLEVTLKTDDGVPISAEWRPARKPIGALVLLHDYRATRKAWSALTTQAQRRQFSVISIDFRGHGKSRLISGIDHGQAVAKRDPKLFQRLHRDIAAAVGFLGKRGFKTKQIILCGAGMGAAAALDYGHRNTAIQGAALLTPVTQRLGLKSFTHISAWRGRRLLFVSTTEDKKKGAQALYARLGERKKATFVEYPQTGVSGTRMLGKIAGIEKRLLDWAKTAITR